jgi:hypothetical protein
MTTSHGTPIGFLDPDDSFTRRFVERPLFDEQLDRIDMYELPDIDLARYAGIVVSSQVDQAFLYRHRGVVREFLDAGGVVAFSGHLSRRWLPGVDCFEPKTIESEADYAVIEERPHPVFEGVDMADLTYQRGVAGFFARGHNPPPADARTILRLPDGEPVVFVDDRTTNGTMLVHSGNDLIGLGRRSSTAERVPEQLIEWMRAESTVQTAGEPRVERGTDR